MGVFSGSGCFFLVLIVLLVMPVCLCSVDFWLVLFLGVVGICSGVAVVLILLVSGLVGWFAGYLF